MSNDCNYQNILNNKLNECAFVTENCPTSLIPFYEIHYCNFDGLIYFTIPTFLIIGYICFYLLSDTANRYLSPPLTTLSEKLNMSQNLAGVTLLALGNGAPDVISSIVASENVDSGIEFSVGALTGAGIFVTSIVISSVIFFAKKVTVNRSLYIRDLAFYIISLVLLLIFSLDNKITLLESISFYVIYFIYVTVAIIQESHFKEIKKNQTEENNENEYSNEQDVIDISKEGQVTYISKLNVNSFNSDTISNFDVLKDDYVKIDEGGLNDINCNHNSKFVLMMKYFLSNIKYKLVKHYFVTKDVDFIKMKLSSKIFFLLIDFPFNLLRNLTIPNCELHSWNRSLFILMPLSSTVFIVVGLKKWSIFFDNWIILVSTLSAIILLMIIIFYTTYRNRLPRPLVLICFIAFFMSIFWIWMAANILIDLLNTLGDIFNVPSTLLAITLLAMGNSAADLTLNCALAKIGYGEMGVAGSIAGPLFNLLIGLGTGLFKQTIKSGSIQFNLFQKDKNMVLICVLFLIFNLIRLLIQGIYQKFNLSKSVSIIGYIVYFAFFALIITFSIIK